MTTYTEQDLATIIIKASTQYYNGIDLDLTDAQFDHFVEALRKLNPNHWILSATGWGYKPIGAKCPHIGKTAVGSIKTKLKYPEMGNEYMRVAFTPPKMEMQNKEIGSQPNCLALPKLDGASVILYFSNTLKSGMRFKALTRGSDNIGVDVTPALQRILEETCPSVFTSIDKSFRTMFSVRGEVIVPLENEEAIKATGMKNTRNAASGILNRKELSEELKYLRFIPYFIRIDSSNKLYEDHGEMLEELLKLGFTQVQASKLTLPKPETLQSLFKTWQKIYPVDGLVLSSLVEKNTVQYDYTHLEEKTVAYKFDGEEVEVVVKDILWQVGSQGNIVPVVKFDPVTLAGASVEKATAHNYNNLASLGIAPGAIIKVIRSGEVIPYITGVAKPATKLLVPVECPSCSSKLFEEGVHLKCGNENCGPRAFAGIKRLIQVSGEVDGLDDTTIQKWCDGINVKTLAELFDALEDKPVSSPDKEYRELDLGPHYSRLLWKLYNNINSKYLAGYSYQEFWYICNLASISESNSKKLASINPVTATMETFGGMGLAVNVLKSIKDNFDYWKSIAIRLKLNATEVKAEGISFCVTGKLSVSRDEFVKAAEQRGFTFHDSVKKTTQYLVCNEGSSSSKALKAIKQGTKVITEQEFLLLSLG